MRVIRDQRDEKISELEEAERAHSAFFLPSPEVLEKQEKDVEDFAKAASDQSRLSDELNELSRKQSEVENAIASVVTEQEGVIPVSGESEHSTKETP